MKHWQKVRLHKKDVTTGSIENRINESQERHTISPTKTSRTCYSNRCHKEKYITLQRLMLNKKRRLIKPIRTTPPTPPSQLPQPPQPPPVKN